LLFHRTGQRRELRPLDVDYAELGGKVSARFFGNMIRSSCLWTAR
jgi:hypothetical protein